MERCAIHEAAHIVACLCLAIPILSATVKNDARVYRGHYRPPHDAGVECMVILCLSGAEAERAYCGPITDASDRTDIAMAKSYLTRAGFDLLKVEAEIVRLRAAAERLVTSPFARQRIPRIAEALLKRGSLTGTEITELS